MPQAKGGGTRRMALATRRLAVDGELSEEWFEVARCGNFYDWRYGNFSVTAELLNELVANFAANVLKTKVALDCNHEPDKGAFAWIAELKVQGDSLMARFEDWTPEGERLVREGAFRYFSIEFSPFEEPAEDGVKVTPNVLKGIALTNRPVLKGMDGTFSDRAAVDEELNNPRTEKTDGSKPMKNIVRKYGESLVAGGKVSKADAERMEMMLAELDQEGKAELKELADRVTAKASETEAMELAEKKKSEDAAKQLAELTPRLKAVEEQNAAMLAEKAANAAKEVVESMILSEKVSKGFPSGKKAEVEKLVAEIGTENAVKVAAMLSEVVDATGKTAEYGTGAAPAKTGDDAKADMALAEAKAKETGKPVHACLEAIYSERERAKA